MDVLIEEVVGTIRAVDGEQLLDARQMARLVQAVVQAIEAGQARDRRRRDETRIADDRGRPPAGGHGTGGGG
jgi:hypothetical protein